MISSYHFILNYLVLLTAISLNASPLCERLHNKPSIACEFQFENGNYNLVENDLVKYFDNQALTKGLFNLKLSLDESYKLEVLQRPAKQQTYKINSNNEFQAQNWYSYSDNLRAQQLRWETNINKFNKSLSKADFNSAKRFLFSQFPFSWKTFEIQLPYTRMAEWGGLAHPPIHEIQITNLLNFSEFYPPLDYSQNTIDKSPLFSEEFQINLDKISRSELTKGNSFKLVADSKSFEAKLNLIQSAKKTIWLSSLVFVEDSTTNQIVEALIKKAKEELKVWVITENMMSYFHNHQIHKMQNAGIKVLLADDFFNYNTQTIYHSKVLVVDDSIAIVGGQNMIDADLGSKGTDLKNRDLDVQITGPLVTDVTLKFIQDWHHFTTKSNASRYNRQLPIFDPTYINKMTQQKVTERQSGLRGQKFYALWLNDKKERLNGLGRFIAQKPYLNESTITDTYIQLINSAQNYLGITNPQAKDTFTTDSEKINLKPIKDIFTNFNRLFLTLQNVIKTKPNVHLDYITSNEKFVFNEAVPMTVERIKNYLQKGKIFSANLNQIWLTDYSLKYAEPQYLNLINDYLPYPNVNVWLHISFIHSKILYIDRIAASIGSFNIHHNATDHAYESTVLAMDANLNQQLDQAMIFDMANSNPFIFAHPDN